jgi:hypothetical protein
MKKNALRTFLMMVLAAIIIVPTMQSCKSKKDVQKPSEDEVLIQTYCSGPEYWTNKDFFRANSIGESTDQVMSKKKAMSNCKQELAGSMETTIKAVIDNYFSSHEANNVEDIREKYEGLSREVIKQELSGIKTICEKQTKTKQGTYKTYLAIELSGDEIVNAMKDRLSDDTKMEIDFQYEKFKEELEKEMENYKGGN